MGIVVLRRASDTHSKVVGISLLGQGLVYLTVRATTYWIWSKEFAPDGNSLMMLSQLARRHLPWPEVASTVRKGWLLILATLPAMLFIMIGSVYYLWPMLQDGLPQMSYEYERAGAVLLVLFWSIPETFAASVTIAHAWITYFVCQLHKHDLLSYAAAVTRALEVNDGEMQVVEDLDNLEVTVTARFRQANERWVPLIVYTIITFFAAFLVLVVLVITQPLHIFQRVCFVFCLIMLPIFMWVLGYPLSMVSEVFEFDVLRTLNRPLLLFRAQRFFGQQLLKHLSLLEWGYRFGGTLITPRFVSNIAVGLAITALTTISQVLFDNSRAL